MLSEEQNGKFFMGGDKKNYSNLILPNQPLEREFKELRDKKEEEEVRALYLETVKAKQEELEAKLATLEIMPVGNRIIVLPYMNNPYKNEITKGGIIMDYDGEFLNPDTGLNDKLKPTTSCGQIIEVGPDCTFVKPGDDIFYPTLSVLPIPFMNRGYVQLSEPQVLAVINEGLTDRFNSIKNKNNV